MKLFSSTEFSSASAEACLYLRQNTFIVNVRCETSAATPKGATGKRLTVVRSMEMNMDEKRTVWEPHCSICDIINL